jgi:hypothetical protein
MNVVLTLEQFNKSHLYYSEPIQNIVMDNSKFVKITYSNENVMFSGIYLSLPIKHTKSETYYKKVKILYDVGANNDWLDKIYNIEADILNKYGSSKRQARRLHETMSSGVIKIFTNDENEFINKSSFIVKLSGIWETDSEYGVTYKLLSV